MFRMCSSDVQDYKLHFFKWEIGETWLYRERCSRTDEYMLRMCFMALLQYFSPWGVPTAGNKGLQDWALSMLLKIMMKWTFP